jgi:hypothetical protein
MTPQVLRRTLRTHVHTEWSDEKRSFGWDDHRSTHVSKISISGLIKVSELDEALASRFPSTVHSNLDGRSRMEIIEAYILETKRAGGRANQTGAAKALESAGKKWSRDRVRPAFNELAHKHGITVAKGRTAKNA